MHGMVFGELKKFVDKTLGGDAWKSLLAEAGVGRKMYLPIREYPDEEILALVTTASRVTGLEAGKILEAFGEFIAADLLTLYRRQLDAGWLVMDLFEHVEDTIHKVVRLRNPGAHPPRLKVRRTANNRVTIIYTSERRICALGVGLIRGIAEQFGEPVQVQETSCMLRGDEACVIKVRSLDRTDEFPISSHIPTTEMMTESGAFKPVARPKLVETPPVVVVGTGPVGIHVCRELLHLAPGEPLVVYGEEPWEPYNRVRLSELLAGEIEWDEIISQFEVSARDDFDLRINCRVEAIDREKKIVRDAEGREQPYSHLVLATGSRARKVDSQSDDLEGIYTYRDVADAQELMTYIVQSERTVVTGGGVLGVEVAFALKAQNPDADVLLVHRGERLMNRELDPEASAFLLAQVKKAGIEVLLSTEVVRYAGERSLEAVELADGRRLTCDTVITCAGIEANTALARDAGLTTGRGVVVDDRLLTDDPSISAAGECVEHRGRVYGLLGPGLEHASLVAERLTKGDAPAYAGTTRSMRVKVKHLPIFSLQRALLDEKTGLERLNFQDDDTFRQITLQDGVLVGASAIGAWDEVARVQEAIERGQKIHLWHRWSFRRSGTLWPDAASQNPQEWPDEALVCTCGNVTRGRLGAAMADGCDTVAKLADRTGATQACGSCGPLVARLVGADVSEAPSAPRHRPLLAATLAAWVLTAFAALLGPIAPPASVLEAAPPGLFDFFGRQVSGYGALALMLVASLLLSLNKRMRLLQFATYGTWRVVHVALLLLTVAVVAVHTNFGLGHGFNRQLMAVTFLAFLSGTAVTAIVVGESGFFGSILRRWRAPSLKSHLALFWIFLGFVLAHVLSVYYFA